MYYIVLNTSYLWDRHGGWSAPRVLAQQRQANRKVHSQSSVQTQPVLGKKNSEKKQ